MSARTEAFPLSTPITDRSQIKPLLESLHRRGWLYHFDDDPTQITAWWNAATGEVADPPSPMQLDLIQQRVAEARRLDERAVWILWKRVVSH